MANDADGPRFEFEHDVVVFANLKLDFKFASPKADEPRPNGRSQTDLNRE